MQLTRLPRLAIPSMNCTVPDGVPAVEVTVAVNVTLSPKSDGLTEDETLVPVAAGVFVSAKLTVGGAVPTLATTLYVPALPLAVKVGAVATPLPSALTVTLSADPGNVP